MDSDFGSASFRHRRRAIYLSCRNISRGRSGRAWREPSHDAARPEGPRKPAVWTLSCSRGNGEGARTCLSWLVKE